LFQSGVHGVLDLGHLRDQVGGGEQVRVRVAAGDDDVLVAGPGAQRRDHVEAGLGVDRHSKMPNAEPVSCGDANGSKVSLVQSPRIELNVSRMCGVSTFSE